MSRNWETAYITGGASGIGKVTAEMLARKGIRVFVADRNLDAATEVCTDINSRHPGLAQAAFVELADWSSQAETFSRALAALGDRIDYVYAIAGVPERRWLPQIPKESGFEIPDLGVLDVDLKGTLYTFSLAIQQFRRQDVGPSGLRGHIGCVVSVCGFYCVPTLPIYTAAKHGLVGFIRSYGKLLIDEGIVLNGACPNVVRTGISTKEFYSIVEAQGLFTPLNAVPDTFEALLDGELRGQSGEIFELGPNYGKSGEKWVARKTYADLDAETTAILGLLAERGRQLQSLTCEFQALTSVLDSHVNI